MFAAPFPLNCKPPAGGFVGSIVGNLTLPNVPVGGPAYSPVNRYLYLLYNTSVYVCDLSGTPSIVTTITLAAAGTRLAYLPISDKVYVQQASNKYQLITCSTNVAASQVTMTNPFVSDSYILGSFSVDQSNDDVYMGTGYQLGKVVPSTGVITKTGFGTALYQLTMTGLLSLAYNNADGYLYIAASDAGHMLIVIDPVHWNDNAAKHDFGSTPTNLADPVVTINRATGHVYANANSGPKLYVMSDYQTLTVQVPTAQTGKGDYDTVLQETFEISGSTPGFVSNYDTTDTQLTRTSISSTVANNPVAIYCDSLNGRYAIQKGTSGEVLQIIAR